MAVVGYATIQLIPSLKGFVASTNGQMAPVVKSVGSDAGSKAGGLFGGSFVGAVGKIMAAAGIYEIGSRVASGISSAITTGIKGFADLQTYTISFKTLLGSASAANDMIRDLYAFAAKTPFDVEGSVVGAQKLLGVGVAAKDVIPTLTTLGDAVGALGGSTGDFNSVLLAYSQIMARGKVSTQDLYQISNTGIPIFQLMSKALGKPVGEIQKLIETGKLASEDVLPKLLDVMNQEYGGAMAGQAETLNGLWSTFKDTLSQSLTTALTPVSQWLVSILPGATAAATTAIGWISDKFAEFGNWVAEHKDEIGQIVEPLRKGLEDTDWEGLLTSLGNAFTTFWTIAQPILAEISSTVGDNLPLAVTTLSELIDLLSTPIPEDGGPGAGAEAATEKMGAAGQTATETKDKFIDLNNFMGLSNGVNMTLELLRVAAALASGRDMASLMADMLNGKYGPALQTATRLGGLIGAGTRAVFTAMGASVAQFTGNAIVNIARWGSQTLVTTTTFGAQIVTSITLAGARFVAGFFSGLATFNVKIGSFITSAVGIIKSSVELFRSAGAAIIDGLVRGVTSRIEAAKNAVKTVVDAVAQFLPHSPAPEGPFSGRGWTLYSGRSLVEGFAQGITQRQAALRRTMADTFSTPEVRNLGVPNSLRGAVTASGETRGRAGNYIGSVTLPTAASNNGIIDELNFFLRNLDRGGR